MEGSKSILSHISKLYSETTPLKTPFPIFFLKKSFQVFFLEKKALLLRRNSDDFC
jgi:hypothetical protein